MGGWGLTAMKGPLLWKHPALTMRDTGPPFRGLSRWSPQDQGPTNTHSPLVLASLQAPQSQCAVVFWAGTLPGRKMQVPTQIPPGCFITSKSAWMVVRARKGRAIQGGKRALCGQQLCPLPVVQGGGAQGRADSPNCSLALEKFPRCVSLRVCGQRGAIFAL